ncbi:hypothetical protein B0A49_13263 [Cryomyces minteri]|uniref:F-box domain-containing protein n=1 Tax=Cryomyces minteri TaxID=331657 RepID=A0A4U0WHF7_9PEZI|nr:hypothetical protein B0A49_13263 [Cryomyces minteri]
MFSPLATYYSQEVDTFLSNSGGLTHITRRQFWAFFYEAWKRAFIDKNVKSAWEAAGIYPFNPERVIAIITQQNTTPEPQQVRTPTSARSLRRMFNHMQKDGYVTAEALPLLCASEKLATKLEISQHELEGVKRALVQEKKKRKRGKRLTLYEEGENLGQARFFSPSRVERARQQAADEVEAERQRKQAIQDRKLQAARVRVEKAREKEERKAARVIARETAKVEREREKAERAAKKAAQQASKHAQATKQPRATTIEEGEVIVVRAAKTDAAKPKKRGFEEEEIEVAQKRLHAQPSTQRTQRESKGFNVCLEAEPASCKVAPTGPESVYSKLGTAMCTVAEQKDQTFTACPQRGPPDPSHVLPLELLLEILGYLDATSLVKASAVSRQWRALCLSPHLWKALYLRAGWKVTDTPASRIPDHPLRARRSRQVMLDGVSQDADVPWHFLFRQRTRLKDNWDADRFVHFQLPHPDHAREGHTGAVYAIQQCGRQLVSGGFDGTVRRWNLDNQRLIGRALRGHHGRVYALYWDGGQDIIISGSSCAEVFVWRFSSGELLQAIPHAHDNAVVSLHFSGGVLATGSMDHRVKIWKQSFPVQGIQSLADSSCYGAFIHSSTLEGHAGGVTAVYIHHGQIISGSSDLCVRVWNIDTGECSRTFSNHEFVASVHLDGQILSKGVPHPIQIMDHISGKTVATLCNTSQTLRTAYAKIENGRCLALVSGSREGYFTIWKENEAKKWLPLRRYELCNNVATLDKVADETRARVISRLATDTSEAITGAQAGTPRVDSGEVRKPEIFQVQLDERRLTCCSTRSGIVGLDFGNGDRDIEVASRFFAK